MSAFAIFLLVWYGLQFIEAWVYAGAGYITLGKPVSTVINLFGSIFLLSHVFIQTEGPLTWEGWVLAFYYLLNIGGAFTYIVRGAKTEKWGSGSAFIVTLVFIGILSLWFNGVLV